MKSAYETGQYRNLFAELGYSQEEIDQKLKNCIPDCILWTRRGKIHVLIAPINIGENAVIAAGSTLTNDVQTDSLAIARARQINKDNYYKIDKI